jgi:hypothetical protein
MLCSRAFVSEEGERGYALMFGRLVLRLGGTVRGQFFHRAKCLGPVFAHDARSDPGVRGAL